MVGGADTLSDQEVLLLLFANCGQLFKQLPSQNAVEYQQNSYQLIEEQ